VLKNTRYTQDASPEIQAQQAKHVAAKMHMEYLLRVHSDRDRKLREELEEHMARAAEEIEAQQAKLRAIHVAAKMHMEYLSRVQADRNRKLYEKFEEHMAMAFE
jgi:Skp family chaperone for outer membrane proteins